jgi:4-hydroxyphenylpyruvate dioxygenase
MYKHSIATISLSGSLNQKIKAIAKAGYDGLELFENDLTISDLAPKEVAKIVVDCGLEIVALQPFRDYEAVPHALHLQNLERAKHKFELMHQLGTKMLCICSNTLPQTINDLDLAAEQLQILASLAEKEGFTVAYEALSWGKYVNRYTQSVEIVRRANHPALGNLLDPYHIMVMGDNFDLIPQIPREKMAFVQVDDAHRLDMSAIYLARHHRCFPGQGTYPILEFMQAVQKTGYDGYLSHEIFSDDFRAARVEATALDGKRSLIWLEEVTKQTAEGQNPHLKNHLTQAPPSIAHFEFIEFSTHAIAQQSLIELLTNLGFQETFTHKNRDISLYQNGGVTLVLNRETPPLLNHVTNKVSAIGYAVEHPECLENWAKQLRYEWIPSTAQMVNLPAVKGVGDILCYIIDKKDLQNPFYENEFESTDGQSSQNGIYKIDHIGHTVAGEYFQSNTLFYRIMLGLDIEESLELFDPNGIVYSRVLKNKDKNVRISLSATHNRNTSSDYFINKIGSGGIQQIAFATNDIFRTAANIQQKEYILPIPSNYYADLRAKGILSVHEIERMQALHILYDTNANGSFYHFYCKELNGLFVEIVQRIGHYDRYGETNAQLRLAAQARNRQ